MSDASVSHWVITHGTSDKGDKYVVREHVLNVDSAFPHLVAMDCTEHDTLDAARVAVPDGLIPVPRLDEDDPVIVEIWI